MITSSRAAAALALAATVATGAASPTDPRWVPDLTTGERAGVVVDADGVRLDPAAQGTHPRWLGLLTLPVHAVPPGTDRVATALDADVPQGAAATLDVRGRTATGWSEWLPTVDGVVALPEPTSEVQGRLVLTGSAAAQPVVHAAELTPRPTERPRITVTNRPTLAYTVFATREGLVGGTTANGHVIDEDDLFVALPSRRALAPRGGGDYTVRVCAGKRCAWAPVWDVGPWNTRDDYWNPRQHREEWKALPQGVPQAQMAHLAGFNDGRDESDRVVLNPAGIDLSDAVFEDVLRLQDNAWVTVDYLWTGADPKATVDDDGPVEVRAAAEDSARVVGVAAGGARVPAACTAGRWLRIGEGQFLPVDATRVPRGTPRCPGTSPGESRIS